MITRSVGTLVDDHLSTWAVDVIGARGIAVMRAPRKAVSNTVY